MSARSSASKSLRAEFLWNLCSHLLGSRPFRVRRALSRVAARLVLRPQHDKWLTHQSCFVGLSSKDPGVRLHDNLHHEAEDEAVPNDVLGIIKILQGSTKLATEAKRSSTTL